MEQLFFIEKFRHNLQTESWLKPDQSQIAELYNNQLFFNQKLQWSASL